MVGADAGIGWVTVGGHHYLVVKFGNEWLPERVYRFRKSEECPVGSFYTTKRGFVRAPSENGTWAWLQTRCGRRLPVVITEGGYRLRRRDDV